MQTASTFRVRSIACVTALVVLVVASFVSRGDQGQAAFGPEFFQSLTWRNIGPNRGGRSIAVAGSPSRPFEYYFGATGGGLWKTTDGGQTWAPVTDGRIRSSSVGAIAVADTNPDIVYLGMGEVQLRGNVMQGDGVYKSADAGRTWTHVGLSDTHAIGRVRIHPANPDVVYVAALGHPYGPNAERGVFRTGDGGKTWKKVLYRSDRAGAVDLCLDPRNPQVLYAATWEVFRTPWLLSSGGPGSGLFKSSDGGDTWTEITRNPGLPKGLVGKVAVTVSPVSSQRVFALVEAEDGGLFRSDDAGATWIRVNQSRDLRQRAFYFSRIYADPKALDTVYVLNFLFHKSVDGGKTFTTIDAPHVDHHDLWIDPANPLRMVNANDGGGNVTINGGRTWTAQRYPTAQMYTVATTRDFPYHVCGAQQDNTTACVQSDGAPQMRTLSVNPGGDYFYPAGGNESGWVMPHAADPNIFYGGGQEAYLTRFDRATGEARDIQPFPRYYSGQSAGSVPERWQWTFPIAVTALDPHVLFVGSQHLWRTTNEGQSWEKISPDLTRADPKTLGDSGGPITKDQNGPEFYATIFAIAPSRHERDTIWVGSDDGRVHVTRDGGKTWNDITPPDMPEFTTVSLIDASPHTAGAAFVAAQRYRLDDRAPYIWATADYGRTWKRIVGGIRADDYVHAVREDPVRPGLLYAGTEHGVYVSFDGGSAWQSLSLNLPDVQVSGVVVEAHDLVIATHGRSFYVLDNIDLLRQATPDVASAAVHLFQPREAVRRVYPAVFDYWLQRQAASVSLEVVDATGAVVKRMTGAGMNRAGVNRVTWDLRYPGAAVFEGLIVRSAQPARGPLAAPGEYQVRLIVDGRVQSRTFGVTWNPRLKGVTAADLREQFALAMKIRDKTSAAHDAIIRIRAMKQQASERLRGVSEARVLKAMEAFVLKISAVEEELYQVRNRSPKDPLNFPVKLNNRIAALQRVVESAEARPTDQCHTVFALLSDELAASLSKLDSAVNADLAALNALLKARRLAAITDSIGK
ncbi:MAG: glycosyl hydrolase [Acidobacteria bacterium]|nr:glycosyl hydrolase [Acidobacteriota bacterium]